MKQYIEIGKITNTHALKGELKMIYWCDDPHFLISIDNFFLDENGENKLKISHARFHKHFLIFKAENVNDISTAQNLLNKILYIPRNKILLTKGEYLQQDLIGINVNDFDNNKHYGKIFKITQTGANDIYYIKDHNGKELLIPAIKDVIKKVDLKNNVMLIKPLNGLFDL